MDPNAKNKETMEKSFNESLEALTTLLDGDGSNTEETELNKAKKASPKSSPAESSSESEEEERPSFTEEEEIPAKKGMKKSVEDVVEEDDDAQVAVDVEPFLKSMLVGIDARFDGIAEVLAQLSKSMKYLHKKIKRVEEINKALATVSRNAFEMQKSIGTEVEKIGKTPVPSKSVLMKGGDRFAEDGSLDMTKIPKQEILNKALELRMKGVLAPIDVTLIEGRLNAGGVLDPKHANVLAQHFQKSVQ